MRVPAVLLAGVILLGAPAFAQDREKPSGGQSAAFRDLVDCRKIAEAAARLACYDARVGRLDEAERAGELVVADKETMRATRRGLFGFRLPSLGIFGRDGGKQAPEEEIEEVQGTLASAAQFGYGNWRMTLADGAVWEQTDGERLPLSPRAGNTIVIRRAALGNYKARVNGQPPIKVRRVE